PGSLDIGNSCSVQTAAPITITVKWEKKAAVAGGPVTIVAKISATNPASRIVTVSGTDLTYRGSLTPGQGQQFATDTFGPVDVPANTSQFEVATITTVDSNAFGITQYNDVVTVTYTDKL